MNMNSNTPNKSIIIDFVNLGNFPIYINCLYFIVKKLKQEINLTDSSQIKNICKPILKSMSFQYIVGMEDFDIIKKISPDLNNLKLVTCDTTGKRYKTKFSKKDIKQFSN